MAKKLFKDLLNETRSRRPLDSSAIGPTGITSSLTGNNIFVGPTAPASGKQGDFWFNTSDATLYISLYDENNNLVFVRPQ